MLGALIGEDAEPADVLAIAVWRAVVLFAGRSVDPLMPEAVRGQESPVAHRCRSGPRAAARTDRVGRRRDAVVIEDDYDAEFRYDRDPVGALQGLAADRVISIGTVSSPSRPRCASGGCSALPRSPR